MTRNRPIIGTYSDANTAIGIIYGSPSKKPTKRDLHRRYRIVVCLPPEHRVRNGALDFTVKSDAGDLVESDFYGDLLELQNDLVDRRVRQATVAIIDRSKSRIGTPIYVTVMHLGALVDEAIAEAEEEEPA